MMDLEDLISQKMIESLDHSLHLFLEVQHLHLFLFFVFLFSFLTSSTLEFLFLTIVTAGMASVAALKWFDRLQVLETKAQLVGCCCVRRMTRRSAKQKKGELEVLKTRSECNKRSIPSDENRYC
jgi:hypothetical protein